MPKKVFELAKELEIGPLDLVESLKAKGFSVRNHMAELSDEDVEKFLNTLKKEKEDVDSLAADTKKKIVRKKVPSTETKTTEKKVVEKKLVEKKTADTVELSAAKGCFC